MSKQKQPAEQDAEVLAHFGQMVDDPESLIRGEGAYVYDSEGKEYLDFTSQLFCVNAGHGNEAIRNAIKEQVDRIQYVSTVKHNDARSRLADRLIEVAPTSMSDVFFGISGSEANEAALQIAREYQHGNTVLSRYRSYHGSTYTAVGLTGAPSIRTPIEAHASTTGSEKFLPPFAGVDAPFNADSPGELAEQAADHLEYTILNEGPDSVAAVITEIVSGSSGAFAPPPGYFERVREICDEYDVLLIADEVITGFGRCGDWFASMTENLQPDMLTFAKGVTSAYLPLSGVMLNEDISEYLKEHGLDTGQTFAGNPMACAAGLAAIDEYENGLLENVQTLSPVLEEEVHSLEEHDTVGHIHGRGFLWALELVDPDTGGPIFDPRVQEDDNPVTSVIEHAHERGVSLMPGRPGFQIMICPPFCVDESDIQRGVEALDAALTAVFDD